MTENDDMDSMESIDVEMSLSFLLRAWTDGPDVRTKPIAWRYSLKDLTTRAQRGFANLDALHSYLEALENQLPSLPIADEKKTL